LHAAFLFMLAKHGDATLRSTCFSFLLKVETTSSRLIMTDSYQGDWNLDKLSFLLSYQPLSVSLPYRPAPKLFHSQKHYYYYYLIFLSPWAPDGVWAPIFTPLRGDATSPFSALQFGPPMSYDRASATCVCECVFTHTVTQVFFVIWITVLLLAHSLHVGSLTSLVFPQRDCSWGYLSHR
jgi:hypothetical protein